jgi:HEAT repeat protein
MIATLSTLTLALACSPDAPAPGAAVDAAPLAPAVEHHEEEDPAKAAREGLKSGLKSKEASERVAALDEHGRFADSDVVKQVTRAVKDRDVGVRQAAIGALRWNEHPDALRELNKLAKDKKLIEDQTIGPLLMKAAAWKGDPSSVDALSSKVFSTRYYQIVEARILGLGMIRDASAVEALIDLLKKVRPNDADRYMDDFRLSLVLLTGVDHGKDPRAWQDWWTKNRRGFEVAAEPPELPRVMQVRWDDYWGIRRKEKRGERREDRGSDS